MIPSVHRKISAGSNTSCNSEYSPTENYGLPSSTMTTTTTLDRRRRSLSSSRTSSFNSLIHQNHYHNNNERPDSQMSLMSNVSGFEDELYYLRTLTTSPPPATNQQNQQIAMYQLQNAHQIDVNKLNDKIEQLQMELKKGHHQWEQLKYENVQLKNEQQHEYDQKYQKLLTIKTAIEYDKNNLENKLNNLHKNTMESQLDLQQRFHKIVQEKEQSKCELNQTIEQLKSIKNDKMQLNVEQQNSRTATHLIEMQFEAQQSINDALKRKIMEQHVQIQELAMNETQLEKQIASLTIDLDTIKKSELWYKQEYYQYQRLTSELKSKCFQLEEQQKQQHSKMARLKIHFQQLAEQCSMVEQQAITEKSQLLQKLEKLQLHPENNNNNFQNDKSILAVVPQKTPSSCNEHCLENMEKLKSLSRQLETQEKLMEQQKLDIKELLIKNNELQSTNVTMEINLNLSGDKLKSTSNEIKQLNENYQLLKQKLKQSIEKYNSQLIELNAMRLERKQIDELIKKLKFDIEQLLKKYHYQNCNLQEQLQLNELQKNQIEQHENDHALHIQTISDLQSKSMAFTQLQMEFNQIECNSKTIQFENQQLNIQLENQLHAEHDHRSHTKFQTDRINQLEMELGDVQSQLNKCQQLNEQYENEKQKINENILELKQSSISDRLKFERIKREKNELRLKLLNLNSELLNRKTTLLGNYSSLTDATQDKSISSCLNIDDNQNRQSMVLLINGHRDDDDDDVDGNTSKCDDMKLNDKKIQSINNESEIDSLKIMEPKDNNNQYLKEIQKLKTLLKVLETENNEKLKRYDINIRILLKKVKEHMRSRKVAEKRTEAAEQQTIELIKLKAKLLTMEASTNALKLQATESNLKLTQYENEKHLIEEILKQSKISLITNQFERNTLTFILQTVLNEFNENLKKIDQLTVKVREFDNEISNLKCKNINCANELKWKSDECQRVTKEFEFNQNALLEKSKIIEKLQIQLSSMESERDSIELKHSIKTNQYNEIQCDFNASKIKLNTLQLELIDRNRLIEQLNGNIQELELIQKHQNEHTGNIEFELKNCKIAQETINASKKLLANECNQLKKQLLNVQDEKLQLKKHCNELKMIVKLLMDKSKKPTTPLTNNHQQTGMMPTKLPTTKSAIPNNNQNNNNNNVNFARVTKILEKCAMAPTTLFDPLEECVKSLKTEMDTLNEVIRQNTHLRCEMSLMDELKLIN